MLHEISARAGCRRLKANELDLSQGRQDCEVQRRHESAFPAFFAVWPERGFVGAGDLVRGFRLTGARRAVDWRNGDAGSGVYLW